MLPYYIFFVITSLAASPSTLPLTVNDDTHGLSVSVAKTEQESDITLTWLNQTTMHIVWPEKSTDVINLEAGQNFDGTIILFIFFVALLSFYNIVVYFRKRIEMYLQWKVQKQDWRHGSGGWVHGQ